MFHGVAVHAIDLSLEGEHGWVYRDVGLMAEPGSLTAVTGQAGSGRTSLLLTLAGRMKPTTGTLTVGRYDKPRSIRRVAALGLVDGVNDLEKALTVREHLHERSPGMFWGKRQESRAETALALAGLEPSPDDRTLVRDLGREQRVRLGIALALLDTPGLLVLDNVDTGLSRDRQEALWATLEELCGLGLTVIAACTESELATAIHLPSGTSGGEEPETVPDAEKPAGAGEQDGETVARAVPAEETEETEEKDR
ncbi:ABC-type multidrug transport system ATPase subunit [Streptosporangium album]|uniref:ABC-type multidrug transport system ATPase subunit n=1 Tax=Streptosporangium album TaxID=47479 RepID=A0A7W7RXV6_9ACTN|nr:ATP-binding cassette domain-containing protein [Streptosporangium album]MBB4940067.1 ABC-type multidrug transport system ATPase subunit [Streptosporangium album]